MKKKQKFILQAFETLDFDLLEIILGDKSTVFGIPSEIVLSKLKIFAASLRSKNIYDLNFRAVSGTCYKCGDQYEGYMFVNSENKCYSSVIFTGENIDLSCTELFLSENTHDFGEIEILPGLSFFKDERLTYKLSPRERSIKDPILLAMQCLRNYVNEEGLLYSQYFVNWYEEFKVLSLPNKPSITSFESEMNDLLFCFYEKIEILALEETAKSFYDEFLKYEIITAKSIEDWLKRCDEIFSFHNLLEFQNINYHHKYFVDQNLKFDLSEFFYFHSLCNILLNYGHWIFKDTSSLDDEVIAEENQETFIIA